MDSRPSPRLKRSAARAGLLVLLVAALCSFTPAAVAADSWQVSAWTFGSRTSLQAAVGAGALDEVQTDWYTVRANGALVAQDADPTFVQLAHSLGCRVLATVSNYSGADFSPQLADAILGSPAARARLIAELVAACRTVGYDGIDLDFESVPAADRGLLSSLVEELATALHAEGKILAMAVHPKTSEPGDWFGARAEDYARLGAAVDAFQVMTYAYSGPWSRPGPIAPPKWADRVLDFAESQVDPAKIWMGVPFYGADWWPGGGAEISWKSATRRLAAHHSARLTRTPSREARFTYRDGRGRRHTVYFQDRVALAAKLAVLREHHPSIAGIAIWVMGGEDPRFWAQIGRRLAR